MQQGDLDWLKSKVACLKLACQVWSGRKGKHSVLQLGKVFFVCVC